MKAVVQTVLIGGGIVGFFIAVPIFFFVWKMRGALSPDKHGYLVMTCFGLPALCIGAVVAGLIWRKQVEQGGMNSADDELDVRAVREMEQRLAKKEAQREWRLWIFTLIAVLVVFGTLAIGMWLAPVLVMRGFN